MVSDPVLPRRVGGSDIDGAVEIDVSAPLRRVSCRALGDRRRDLLAQLADRDLTIREMDHRIKNHLQLLASFTRNLAREPGETPKHLAEEVAAQLGAIAAVHAALHRARDQGMVQARGFLDEICAPFRGLGPALYVRCDGHAELAPRALAPLGMFITEALTNSFKHAFANREDGCVAVGLEQTPSGFHLRVADDGVGMPKIGAAGSGLKLLKSFTASLQGRMSVAAGAAGGVQIDLTVGEAP